MLGQKLKAGCHAEQEDEHAAIRHPAVPHALLVDLEREARRMAGYWQGKRIAEAFLGFVESDPQLVEENLQVYLDREADPRLAEVMTRLESIYQAHRVEA